MDSNTSTPAAELTTVLALSDEAKTLVVDSVIERLKAPGEYHLATALFLNYTFKRLLQEEITKILSSTRFEYTINKEQLLDSGQIRLNLNFSVG